MATPIEKVGEDALSDEELEKRCNAELARLRREYEEREAKTDIQDEQERDSQVLSDPNSLAFIISLNERMAQADLKELSWKGRDDIDDVKRDLELLAQVDYRKAAELWEKYLPLKAEKPEYLESKVEDQKKELVAEEDNPEDPKDKERHLNEAQRVAVEVLKKLMRDRGDSEGAIAKAAALTEERFKTQYVDKALTINQSDVQAPSQKRTYDDTIHKAENIQMKLKIKTIQ